jgi:hypothetical protein
MTRVRREALPLSNDIIAGPMYILAAMGIKLFCGLPTSSTFISARRSFVHDHVY